MAEDPKFVEMNNLRIFWETYARLIEGAVDDKRRAWATKQAREWKPGDTWPIYDKEAPGDD
jgi:hypothetical protein